MEQNSDKDMQLISIPEACKRLGIGRVSVYQQIRKRALKTVKIGGRRLIRIKSLNDYIMALEQ